ncbi:MAG TPA: ArsA-related P-loop ATPase [Solirubrobacteraceae bacterium]|nr:ArsA-related P-loop ATPase [Solirubrobacteraceae bacterium]
MPQTLLSRRLIFVTGKGGVGKTTVALALGLLAAEAGKRTIVADLGSGGDLQERAVAPALYRISVDPQSAMEEYLSVKVPGPAATALRQSRLFQAFAMATPGMRELLCMGKLWELAQFERRTPDADAYDLVIVDAPASGHGAALLRTPRTFAEIARVGPIAHQARTIADTIADPSFTAAVAVSTPEEMPVNETLELREALAAAADPVHLHLVILNARYPDRFSEADAALLGDAVFREPRAPARDELELALAEHRRAVSQATQEQRLRSQFGERLRVLPYLFEPSIELPQLEQLAQGLGL